MKTIFALWFALCLSAGAALPGPAWLASATKAAGSSGPSWIAEIGAFAAVNSDATTTITTSDGASSGQIVIAVCVDGSRTITGITDDRSNTYVERTNNFNDGWHQMIWTATITTPIQSGDNIVITWDSASFSDKAGVVNHVSGTSGSPFDAGVTNYQDFSSAPSCPITTSAKAVIVGIITVIDQTITYSGSSYKVSRQNHDVGSFRSFYFYTNAPSSGNYDVGGSLSGEKAIRSTMISLK